MHQSSDTTLDELDDVIAKLTALRGRIETKLKQKDGTETEDNDAQ